MVIVSQACLQDGNGGLCGRRLVLDRSICGYVLQAVQVIARALRVACCGEDEARVVLESGQPGRDVSGVIVANFRRDLETGTDESTSELGAVSTREPCLTWVADRKAADFSAAFP